MKEAWKQIGARGSRLAVGCVLGLTIACGGDESTENGSGTPGEQPSITAAEVEPVGASDIASLSFGEIEQKVAQAETEKDIATALRWRLAAVEKAKTITPLDSHYLSALRSLGYHYHFHGPGDQAIETFLELVKQCDAILGPDHTSTGDALVLLAGVYFFQGQFEAAEPLYVRLISIREKTSGENSAQLAEALGFRAECLRKLERLDEAAELDKRIAAINAAGPTSAAEAPAASAAPEASGEPASSVPPAVSE